jgi:DNA-binding response OmpR family regulator
MPPEEPHDPSDEESADHAYRVARLRFVTGFGQRLAALRILLGSVSDTAAAGTIEAACHGAHRMSTAGTLLGFAAVGGLAARFEAALAEVPIDRAAAQSIVEAMSAAFVQDLAAPPPSWASEDTVAHAPSRILVVEDDPEQQRMATAGLRAAGFHTLAASDGASALRLARRELPDLILLDVDLPALDGLALCQQAKLDPVLASIPIILVTSRDDLISRMAGLTIGADDHVRKPYASSEMLIRIRRLLADHAIVITQDPAAPCAEAAVLPYEDFSIVARHAITAGPAALVLLRVPSWLFATVSERLIGDLRRRDLFGRHGAAHLILLAPGLGAAEARSAVERALSELANSDRRRIALGVVDTPGGEEAARGFETLVAAADLALADARIGRTGGSSEGPLVLLADDNPDVLQILDARLKNEGYRTMMAFDGEQVLDLIAREQPDILLLALMLPKLTGFDVLSRLNDMGEVRPRTIVVAARELDTDVARALELGADDYVSTPFNPEELLARIARLLR